MIRTLHRLALAVFARLPRRVRRTVVRTLTPSFTVGAIAVIERSDGAVLLVRLSYRQRWGLPGGLLRRGEAAVDGCRREVAEEVGLVVDPIGEPAVVVDGPAQRVDVVYRCRPRDVVLDDIVPGSPEIVEARWFPRDELPELHHEAAGALVALARQAAGDAFDRS